MEQLADPPATPMRHGCSYCAPSVDQIIHENVQLYTVQTGYPNETVLEREVRGRAFADGINAAFHIFGEGVSQAAASGQLQHPQRRN